MGAIAESIISPDPYVVNGFAPAREFTCSVWTRFRNYAHCEKRYNLKDNNAFRINRFA